MTDVPTSQLAAPARPAFNLLDEPWIPVRFNDGDLRDVGLLELFAHSREIEGLAEPSPPEFVALHRLLLAITHRALVAAVGHWNDDERARWFDAGLPTGALRDYLSHWRERFWLFHPTHPFMQVAVLAHDEATCDSSKPWTQVALAGASGNNPVVFDHALDDAPRPTPVAAALRHMLAYLQYAPGQPVKVLRKSGNDFSGPLFNSASAIPVDHTLAGTLVLGLHPFKHRDTEDLPCWEAPALRIADLLAAPTLDTGPCDRYTRQSRAVLLLPDADGRTVTRLRFAEGRALLEDEQAPDPMNSYRPGTNGWVRLTFREGRAVWRELAALLPDASGKAARPAAILSWAANVFEAACRWDDAVDVVVAGLAAKQGKMLRWRAAQFHLPASVLTHSAAASAVRQQLERAESAHSDLRAIVVGRAAQSMRDPGSKDTRKRAIAIVDASAFTAAFFSAVERRLPDLLEAVASGDIERAHAGWSAAMVRAAYAGWQAADDLLGSAATAMRARAMSQTRFDHLVWPLRPASAPATPAMEHYP